MSFRIVGALPGAVGPSGLKARKIPLTNRGLTKGLNPAMAGSVLKESRKKGMRGTEFGAYFYAPATAKLRAIQEAQAMADEALAFDNGWKRWAGPPNGEPRGTLGARKPAGKRPWRR
jgi:hypothetical protein